VKVDLFDFDLPRHFIADRPVNPRDAAKLLDTTGDLFNDSIVLDLPDILKPGDLLIGNDTRVIPARLFGKRGTASVEVTLHKRKTDTQWYAFANPGRKLKADNHVVFSDDFSAIVTEKREAGEVLLQFDKQGMELLSALDRYGVMPLPPYIKRDSNTPNNDRSDYQTVYARRDGAVAAPTAGLHFTDRLLGSLEKKNIGFTTLTLHVGAGTFLPVKVRDTDDHKMHSEWGCIDAGTIQRIENARAAGGRIIAVGTTALRLLETAAGKYDQLKPFSGDTALFITPGYRFKIVDMLLTNFHLPRSTLFMLISAFSGLGRMKAAYEHAKERQYRFYSYGDCCLLKRERNENEPTV